MVRIDRVFLQLSIVLTVLIASASARADFVGPSTALFASSPDGRLVVRIRPSSIDPKTQKATPSAVFFYEYDAKQDSYKFASKFEHSGSLSNLLFVSNAGDLVFVSLGEKDSMRLYAKDGSLRKSWNLADFLKPEEIKGCGQTGATLQWLEEGMFFDRTFQFRGPSRIIRALSAPFTIMRAPDEKVYFTGTIDASKAVLTRDSID